ncbi:MAG: portal protein [Acutalibacteraceae bacterium]
MKDKIKKPDLPKIGKKEIDNALQTLTRYRAGKVNLERRIIENEQWFKLRHWEQMRVNQDEAEPASAWLFNSIANKHADAMDNYPQVICLPREKSDSDSADSLSQILPVIFDRNEFERVYSDAWWQKLKAGTACYGAFWNPRLSGGVGDIEIRQIDILNLFWESGVKNIENSRNLFHTELFDNDYLISLYPELDGKLSTPTVEVSRYIYDDAVDTSEKSVVIDWYYKISQSKGDVLHYCKFCNGVVLYASENDESCKDTGFYSHGCYPFVLDPLFIEEGTPCGFGYIDIMKNTQKQIDLLGSAIINNAKMASAVRYFINSAGSVNEEEFADWQSSFVHVQGSNLGEDSLRQIRIAPISEIYIAILNNKIDELKETSGNRDFSQGSASGGVTAASAIAALQEAGNKLTRDMIKGGYRAFTKLNELCIELIRQFYDEPRCFRITGVGGERDYITYDNSLLKPKNQGNAFGITLGNRLPIFDIKVSSQKASPFTKLSQNELALQLYTNGMFNPMMKQQALAAIEMMDFEGKAQVLARIASQDTQGGESYDDKGIG